MINKLISLLLVLTTNVALGFRRRSGNRGPSQTYYDDVVTPTKCVEYQTVLSRLPYDTTRDREEYTFNINGMPKKFSRCHVNIEGFEKEIFAKDSGTPLNFNIETKQVGAFTNKRPSRLQKFGMFSKKTQEITPGLWNIIQNKDISYDISTIAPLHYPVTNELVGETYLGISQTERICATKTEYVYNGQMTIGRKDSFLTYCTKGSDGIFLKFKGNNLWATLFEGLLVYTAFPQTHLVFGGN